MALEAQNNPFTSVLVVGAADPATLPDADPSAGSYRIAVKTDGTVWVVDSSGTATQIGAGIANPLATDSLWDAAGDLVQGSGANTAAKLSAGTAGKVLTSNGAAAALTWETPAGGGAMATDALWDAAGDLAQGTGANTGAKLSAGVAGQLLKSAGAAAANTWGYPTVDVAKVATSETTTSATAADLTTSGPSVTMTVPASGKVRISVSCQMKNATAAKGTTVYIVVSGANTIAAFAVLFTANATASAYTLLGRETVLTGLTPGSTTFKMQYAVETAGNTGTFVSREISVQAVD